MNTKKPTPVFAEVPRNRCPVCDKVVYSATGIHPQCAMSRESSVLREAQKLAQAAEPPKPAPPQPKSHWLKTCPKCKRQVTTRRFTCDCGHTFEAHAGR